MPDKHKLKLFGKNKHDKDDELSLSTSNHSHGSTRKFLGFHIGRHESGDSLTSPVMSNSSESHHHSHHPHQANSSANHRNPSPVHSNTGTATTIPSIQSPQPQASGLHRGDSDKKSSGSVVDLKKFFKTKKTSNPRKEGHSILGQYSNQLHSPPPMAQVHSPGAGSGNGSA